MGPLLTLGGAGLAVVPPFVIDPTARMPLYQQIEEQVRSAILDGRLSPGARLPSVRELCARLEVARVTVATAYAQLVAEGYLTTKVGSGTRVATDLPEEALFVRHRPRQRVEVRLGLTHELRPMAWPRRLELVAPSAPPVPPLDFRFDFRPDTVGIDLFPFALWERLLRDAWRLLRDRNPSAALDYGSLPVGNGELRRAIAEYVGMARAVRCDPDQIAITRGGQGAFAVVARLFPPGSRCVVEDPGYVLARRALELDGVEVVAVPVDADGIVVDRLPTTAEGALVTPSWQYPRGGTMPIARRIELLRWAYSAGALIVEDDYDSELRYEGHPVPSLQGIDDGSHVLYVGTFSKVIFPGLRLGYAVVPRRALPTFASILEVTERDPPALEQQALAQFIAEGHFERHLRRLREAYAARQEAMLTALGHHCAGLIEVHRVPAGMHLVARLLDERVSATSAARAARAEGMFLGSMYPSRIAPAADRELLLGFAGSSPERISQGVEVLGAILRSAAARDYRGVHEG
jgi:GntR family transcriptional regulator/MocR family aminotransferase